MIAAPVEEHHPTQRRVGEIRRDSMFMLIQLRLGLVNRGSLFLASLHPRNPRTQYIPFEILHVLKNHFVPEGYLVLCYAADVSFCDCNKGTVDKIMSRLSVEPYDTPSYYNLTIALSCVCAMKANNKRNNKGNTHMKILAHDDPVGDGKVEHIFLDSGDIP